MSLGKRMRCVEVERGGVRIGRDQLTGDALTADDRGGNSVGKSAGDAAISVGE
jgi:hypothetical protein